MNWYMEMVDDDIVLEAINIFGEEFKEKSDMVSEVNSQPI